jgi:hypothetical protein
MDGLDRLIEMLEKRFGKVWADALLLTAVLGAAAWGIHSLFVYLLLPIANATTAAIVYLRGGPIALTPTQIISLSVEVIVIGLSIIWVRQSVKWWRMLHSEEAATLRRQGLELDALLDQSKKYLMKQAAAEAQIKSLVPSPQSPPGIEEKTQR